MIRNKELIEALPDIRNQILIGAVECMRMHVGSQDIFIPTNPEHDINNTILTSPNQFLES